jgi:hypothetical protein
VAGAVNDYMQLRDLALGEARQRTGLEVDDLGGKSRQTCGNGSTGRAWRSLASTPSSSGSGTICCRGRWIRVQCLTTPRRGGNDPLAAIAARSQQRAAPATTRRPDARQRHRCPHLPDRPEHRVRRSALTASRSRGRRWGPSPRPAPDGRDDGHPGALPDAGRSAPATSRATSGARSAASRPSSAPRSSRPCSTGACTPAPSPASPSARGTTTAPPPSSRCSPTPTPRA